MKLKRLLLPSFCLCALLLGGLFGCVGGPGYYGYSGAYPVYRVVQPQRTIWPADVWVQGPFGPQRLSGYTVGPNPNAGVFYPNVWQVD